MTDVSYHNVETTSSAGDDSEDLATFDFSRAQIPAQSACDSKFVSTTESTNFVKKFVFEPSTPTLFGWVCDTQSNVIG